MTFCLNWTYKKINRKLCVESRVKPVPMKKPHSNSYELILLVFVLFFFFLIADGQHKFGTQYKLFHSLYLSHSLLPLLLLFLWDVFSIKYVVLPSPPQKLPLPLKFGGEKRRTDGKRMETNRKKDEWKEFVATTSVFDVYCQRFLWRFSLLVIIFFLSLFDFLSDAFFFSILFLNKL